MRPTLELRARKGVRAPISAPGTNADPYAAAMSILAILIIVSVIAVVIVLALILVDR